MILFELSTTPSQSKITGFANPWGAGHKYHGYYDTHTRFNDNFQDGLFEWNVKTVIVKIHQRRYKEPGRSKQPSNSRRLHVSI